MKKKKVDVCIVSKTEHESKANKKLEYNKFITSWTSMFK